MNGPAFPTSSVCVKKEIAEKCQGFNENTDFIAWEDFDFWLKISKITNHFVKIPKTLGFLTIDYQNFLNEEILIKYIFSFKKIIFLHKNFSTFLRTQPPSWFH